MDKRDQLRLNIRTRLESNGVHLPETTVNMIVDEAHKLWPRKRSNDQNAYWHGGIVKPLADYLGYMVFEMHELLKLQFLSQVVTGLDGVPKIIGGSTADLSTVEFSDLCFKVRTWADTDLNFTLEPPPEKFMQSAELEKQNEKV